MVVGTFCEGGKWGTRWFTWVITEEGGAEIENTTNGKGCEKEAASSVLEANGEGASFIPASSSKMSSMLSLGSHCLGPVSLAHLPSPFPQMLTQLQPQVVPLGPLESQLPFGLSSSPRLALEGQQGHHTP